MIWQWNIKRSRLSLVREFAAPIADSDAGGQNVLSGGHGKDGQREAHFLFYSI